MSLSNENIDKLVSELRRIYIDYEDCISDGFYDMYFIFRYNGFNVDPYNSEYKEYKEYLSNLFEKSKREIKQNLLILDGSAKKEYLSDLLDDNQIVYKSFRQNRKIFKEKFALDFSILETKTPEEIEDIKQSSKYLDTEPVQREWNKDLIYNIPPFRRNQSEKEYSNWKISMKENFNDMIDTQNIIFSDFLRFLRAEITKHKDELIGSELNFNKKEVRKISTQKKTLPKLNEIFDSKDIFERVFKALETKQVSSK